MKRGQNRNQATQRVYSPFGILTRREAPIFNSHGRKAVAMKTRSGREVRRTGIEKIGLFPDIPPVVINPVSIKQIYELTFEATPAMVFFLSPNIFHYVPFR